MRGASRSWLVVVLVVGIGATGCGDGKGHDGDGGDPEPADTAATATVTPVATPTRTPPVATASPTTTPVVTGTLATATDDATPTPTATVTPPAIAVAEFVGVYDAGSAERGRGVAAEWIAFVDGESNADVTIVIFFDGHSSLFVSGVLGADGRIDLEGQGVSEDDIIYLPTGSATFATADGVQRIAGTLIDETGGGFEGDFLLERPVGASSAAFAGTYHVTFTPSPGGCACSSAADFTIAVGANGFGGTATPADETDTGSMRQGTFNAGDCWVAASGRVRCRFGYTTTFVPPPGVFIPAGPSFPVTLTGILTSNGGAVSGSGDSAGPIFPSPYFLGGTWSATRTAGGASAD